MAFIGLSHRALRSEEASVHKTEENGENTGTADDACEIHLFGFVEEQSAEEQDQSLSDISEHGSEDKGVSDRHKPGRVHFVVSRKTVHLDIHFKWFKKFRVSKFGRRFFLRRCLLVFHETEDLVIILDVLLECEGIFFCHPAAEDVECVCFTLCAGCKFTDVEIS